MVCKLVGPTFGLAFGLGLGLGTGAAGCKVQSVFTCSEDANCETHGAGGICEPNAFCTFPDESCPSGKRWHDRAGDLADECYELDTAGTGDGSGGSEGSGSTAATPDDESSGGNDSTPVTSGDSSGEPPPMTTTDPGDGSSSGGGGSTTGMAGACDAKYGAATDYMLCEELPDSCMFNVTTGMAMGCTGVCTSFGGTCITAHTNDVDLCVPVMETTCDDMASNNIICVCSND